MGLTKLGKYIVPLDYRNTDNLYNEDAVVGLSTQKMMISTKADLTGVNLTSYKLMPPGSFAYVPDTSRRGNKMSLAFNSTNNTYLVSSISIVFIVNKPDELISDYLFMYFNRPEFDRYSRFNSWGSARETFSWDDMCDIDIELPPVPIQQKYVDVYNSMVANQQCYERGLEDLKLVCDAYIEDLRRRIPCKKIGPFISELNNRVSDSKKNYSIDDIAGISSIDKHFMKTKANTKGLSISSYKIVPPNAISFNPNTARMGDRIPIALNDTNSDYLVSAIYPVFEVDQSVLIPEYLMMWFKRTEFDRYARYNSWGSARETFNFTDMQEIQIPIPNVETQQAIVDIYNSYIMRKDIYEKLKAQIKDLCPILIKGSLEEASA